MQRARDWTDALFALALIAGALALYVAYAAALGAGRPRPASLVGHGLGVVGYLLMLWAAFGYSWRKDPARSGPGSGRAWLRAHVVAGLLGPSLVLLHTGLAFRGLAGATTLLMLVVVASGVVGRYVYATLPKGADPADVEAMRGIDEVMARLEPDVGVPAGAADASSTSGGTAVMMAAVAAGHALDAERRTLRARRAEHERRVRRDRAGARRRRAGACWWVRHVPLSAAMLLLGLVHAVAALYYATFSR